MPDLFDVHVVSQCKNDCGSSRDKHLWPAKELSVADFPKDLFYTNQTVSNACGTVALLHAVGNNVKETGIAQGGVLSKFYEATASMSPKEKAKFMETFEDLASAHKQHAQEGNATEVRPL